MKRNITFNQTLVTFIFSLLVTPIFSADKYIMRFCGYTNSSDSYHCFTFSGRCSTLDNTVADTYYHDWTCDTYKLVESSVVHQSYSGQGYIISDKYIFQIGNLNNANQSMSKTQLLEFSNQMDIPFSKDILYEGDIKEITDHINHYGFIPSHLYNSETERIPKTEISLSGGISIPKEQSIDAFRSDNNFDLSIDRFVAKNLTFGVNFIHQSNKVSDLDNLRSGLVSGSVFAPSTLGYGATKINSIFFGPTFRIGRGKLSLDFFAKGGFSQTTPPKTPDQPTNTIRLINFNQKSQIGLGYMTGIGLNLGLFGKTSIFVKSQYSSSNTDINFSSVDVSDPASGAFGTLVNQSFLPSSLNLNVGVRIGLGKFRRKVKSQNIDFSNNNISGLGALNTSANKEEENSDCKSLVLYSGGKGPGEPGTYIDDYQGSIEKPEWTECCYFPIAKSSNSSGSNLRKYDQEGANISLVQSFHWRYNNPRSVRVDLFEHIECAILEFKAKPVNDPGSVNDMLLIYPYNHGPTTTTKIAGANLGSQLGVDGLVGSEEWKYPHPGKVFKIDLKNFPSHMYNVTHGGQRAGALLSGVPVFNPAHQAADFQVKGGYDLTRIMNQLGYLDLMYHDDSIVDYTKLTLYSCGCDCDTSVPY